jgi:hypothetical protein
MFFMRLRNHAKWVFVALAFVFVFSFVVAGVGSGSTGISDLLSSNGGGIFGFFGGNSTSNPVKDAQKQVDKAGKDKAKLAVALLSLANAQAKKGLGSDAEASYVRYLRLKPHDSDAHHQLSILYSNDAQAQADQLSPIEQDVVQSAPSGAKFVTDPIQVAIHQDALSHATDFYKAYHAAKQKEFEQLEAARASAKGTQRNLIQDQEGTEAYGAFIVAAPFGSGLPESPAAATAQADATAWAALGVPALKASLPRHKNDGAGPNIQQMLTQLTPYAPAAAKSSGR